MQHLDIPSETTNISVGLLQRCTNLVTISINNYSNFGYTSGVLYTPDYKVALHSLGGWTYANISIFTTSLSPYLFAMRQNFYSISFQNDPPMLETIGRWSFSNCTNLRSFPFKAPLNLIDERAFLYSGITKAVLPSTIKNIGYYAFAYCDSLIKVDLKETESNYVNSYCFYQDPNLREVTLGPKTQYIYDFAFAGSAIENITIPTEILDVYTYVFANSPKLTEVIFLDSTKYLLIKECAFMNCSSLKTIRFSNKLQQLSSMALADCTSLTTIEFGDSPIIKQLSSLLFKGCSSISSFMVPSSIVTIDASVFYKCINLRNFDTSRNNRFTVFNGILYSIDKKILYAFPPAQLEGQIATEAQTINTNAFYGVLMKTLDFMQSQISTIEEYAFFECTNLKTLTIPASVETIKMGGFESCSGLTHIKFDEGSKLKKVESGTFKGCVSLENLEFAIQGSCLTEIDDNTFYKCNSLQKVVLPSTVSILGENSFAECSSLLSIDLSNTEIKEIPSKCFYSCWSLKDIKLPESIEKIHQYSLFNCTNIVNITIPKNTSFVDSFAFTGCSSLSFLRFESPNVSISESAFEGCSLLSTIQFFGNVSFTGLNIFKNCKNVRTIYFCGVNSDQNNVFDHEVSQRAVVRTLFAYPSNRFCGLPVIKEMSACMVVPTQLFTLRTTMDMNVSQLVFAVIYSPERGLN